jgi:hypothetical protein
MPGVLSEQAMRPDEITISKSIIFFIVGRLLIFRKERTKREYILFIHD